MTHDSTTSLEQDVLSQALLLVESEQIILVYTVGRYDKLSSSKQITSDSYLVTLIFERERETDQTANKDLTAVM